MRILHVAESWGGGTASSVLSMAQATPELEHHLLAARRADSDNGAPPAGVFASATPLPAGPVPAAARLRAAVARLRPDVVHAHSSIAGAVVRLARPAGTRVVYTPHGFAFDRHDATRAGHAAFRLAERALVGRTDLLAAVSPTEAAAARALGHRAVAHVPNRATLPAPGRARHAARLRVVTVGRVAPAKDWRHLLLVKRYAEDRLGLDATWEWLGGGDPAGEAELRDAGVRVSGWLDHRALTERVATAQAYVHTAAWESAPMSVLEAAALGVPLALRAIPSLVALELPGLCGSVAELAARVAALGAEEAWLRAQAASDAVTARHSREAQGRSLAAAYRRACGDPAAVGAGAGR